MIDKEWVDLISMGAAFILSAAACVYWICLYIKARKQWKERQ